MNDAGQSPRVARLAAHTESVTSVPYVDGAKAEALARLGIHTVADLLAHYPFRYIDLTKVCRIRDVTPGIDVTVVGRVREIHVKQPKPRLTIVEVAITDGHGGMLVGVWFNQPYMAQRFVEGERIAFAGTPKYEFGLTQIRNPFVEKLGAEDDGPGLSRILPIHHCTEGLSTNWTRRLIAGALEAFGDVPDFLPATQRASHDLVSTREALRSIHFPDDEQARADARRRLAYDELFCLQLGMVMRRHRLTVERSGVVHIVDGPSLRSLQGRLPFALTDEQNAAIDEILADMRAPHPMNRMLLGDVGTGKTIVAAHALAAAADSGHQAAMMAPTEVLALQYASKVGPVLEAAGVSWALLTGSTSAVEKRRIAAAVEAGETSVVFGTHALLEKSLRFADLSLAIVDEQHRFGVGQRLGLRSKGSGADLLVMTATPIPRSLALTFYGDLATSYLTSRPGGRTGAHVTTELVHRTGRERAYRAVKKAVAGGRQAYVVCALVDESDSVEARSAIKEADRLRKIVFPELSVGLLTGRMRPAEKAQVMQRFRDGSIDVLVSTTVIEVGVDVPNATVMIVEDAERFGLAQLHQLRGRIGRGEHPGTFLVFADPKSREGRERMQAIVATNDGFALAEADLALRGAGQLFGERQSGLPELRVASLSEDVELIRIARHDAEEIVTADPALESAIHRPLESEVRTRFGAAWKWVSSG